jgi:hypothetical protein
MAQHVTFWRMKVLPGKVEELRQLMQSEGEAPRLGQNGWASSLVGKLKDNSDEVFGCVTWDTSERYYANAESPEQNAMYEKMRALLAADPEWFDCDVIEERRA